MDNLIQVVDPKLPKTLLPMVEMTREQIDLIKQTVAKGTTDEELKLFLYVCRRTQLDPLLRQIYAVKRWTDGKEVMTIQTGIDGLRLIAERSGSYAPGRETIFTENERGIISATAYCKKLVAGTWHEISATAYFDEYKVTKKDGSLNTFWRTKPHLMIAKCAESLVLRKGWPAEMAGVYTHDEMGNVDPQKPGEVLEMENDAIEPVTDSDYSAPSVDGNLGPITSPPDRKPGCISKKQAQRFYAIGKQAGRTDQNMKYFLKVMIGSEHTSDIPYKKYEWLCDEIAKTVDVK